MGCYIFSYLGSGLTFKDLWNASTSLKQRTTFCYGMRLWPANLDLKFSINIRTPYDLEQDIDVGIVYRSLKSFQKIAFEKWNKFIDKSLANNFPLVIDETSIPQEFSQDNPFHRIRIEKPIEITERSELNRLKLHPETIMEKAFIHGRYPTSGVGTGMKYGKNLEIIPDYYQTLLIKRFQVQTPAEAMQLAHEAHPFQYRVREGANPIYVDFMHNGMYNRYNELDNKEEIADPEIKPVGYTDSSALGWIYATIFKQNGLNHVEACYDTIFEELSREQDEYDPNDGGPGTGAFVVTSSNYPRKIRGGRYIMPLIAAVMQNVQGEYTHSFIMSDIVGLGYFKYKMRVYPIAQGGVFEINSVVKDKKITEVKFTHLGTRRITLRKQGSLCTPQRSQASTTNSIQNGLELILDNPRETLWFDELNFPQRFIRSCKCAIPGDTDWDHRLMMKWKISQKTQFLRRQLNYQYLTEDALCIHCHIKENLQQNIANSQ